ncbi:hypothetical protein OIE66_31090 [Nonomuraea sp. NBC_01738]|uniref:hypothetical protein n=1 Tax=Nonomuraea sp. NBC_01738 TaxID=2976003 RepID=UPI002E111B76|nr:hypothetical protein OIE66_31090 [Nonomuraea sp. NBC_01738]
MLTGQESSSTRGYGTFDIGALTAAAATLVLLGTGGRPLWAVLAVALGIDLALALVWRNRGRWGAR